MAPSKFETASQGFLELIADGLTFRDAARQLEVGEKTVRNWLAKGRGEDSGPHAEFAAAYDSARTEAEELKEPMDREELLLIVSEAARKGSVQAMKLMEEMLRRGQEGEDDNSQDPFGTLDDETEQDELSQRRTQKSA